MFVVCENCAIKLESYLNIGKLLTIIFQGSGWGWLGYNKVAKKLEIAACKDQDLLEATTGPLWAFWPENKPWPKKVTYQGFHSYAQLDHFLGGIPNFLGPSNQTWTFYIDSTSTVDISI